MPSSKGPPLQDIVTWDANSIFVRGERIVFLSGEFHPFRLPSPGLWLDVFQKIRALGFSGVSFYVDWALVEGEPGHIRTDGFFALDEFFDAASQAGIYLIARPGPYINSEVSGGGFPGWLQRIKAIGKIISKAQITNGGPVIVFQPENEYSLCSNSTGYVEVNNVSLSLDTSCLNRGYMAYVEDQYRKVGIVVPFINNDAYSIGNWAPGTGVGEVDIYSFDDYPLGWSIAASNSSDWTDIINPLLVYNYTTHLRFSPNTPFSISEFQGGAPDPWGGVGVDAAAAFVGYEFKRIFYKINYGFRVAMQNLYIIFGGTNWGNLGHPGGYTSYDVGAAIAEDRQVTREKYGELKLQANFLQASSAAYLTTTPLNGTFGMYTDTHDLVVTPLVGSRTNFYIVRHSDYTSFNSTPYKLKVFTSVGNITLPQLEGTLTLNGRDSKFYVTNYDVGGINLIYSTAEIFTWKKSGSKSVLVLYGGANERHEFAVPANLSSPTNIEGEGVKVKELKSSIIVQWEVEPSRRVVHFGDVLEVYLLWRNDAYNYWVLDLPAPAPLGLHVSPSRSNSSVIVKAGYLLRNSTISGDTLYLTGDVNATTEVEVISAPVNISSLIFNGQKVDGLKTTNGRLSGIVPYVPPIISIPSLKTPDWRSVDSLPELESSYNDSLWTPCNHTESNNPRPLSTPTSLYASDYGYNSGSLLYRGHFTANGDESSIYLLTQGGHAFGHSVWLNSTFLGSWPGSPANLSYSQTLDFPEKLQAGMPYVLTVLIDHMCLDENFAANVVTMKDPRGILDYSLSGHENNKSAISWKMTGNLGGEQYRDLSRGPLNEGATFAERQGYHLPGAPITQWEKKSPLDDGLSTAGVGFFATTFDLDIRIRRHFFLPREWLNIECLALAIIRNDSTLLCPKNGEIAVISNGFEHEWID